MKQVIPSSLLKLTNVLLLVVILTGCGGTRKVDSRAYRASQIVETARGFKGTQYRFGGMSRSGIDCSGLIFLAFKQNGIDLPRVSKEQSKTGKKIPLDEVKPGDLIFFSRVKGSRKVTHVGMITDRVDRKTILFIHASSSRGVVESNLMTKYYRGIYLYARRVF